MWPITWKKPSMNSWHLPSARNLCGLKSDRITPPKASIVRSAGVLMSSGSSRTAMPWSV